MKELNKMMRQLITFAMIVVLAAGCAGSKETSQDDNVYSNADDDYNEIERLLGITPDDREEQTAGQEDSGEEDLLDILQISQPEEDNANTSEPLQLNEPSLDNSESPVVAEESVRDEPVVSTQTRTPSPVRNTIERNEPAVSTTTPSYRPNITANLGSGDFEQGYNDAFNLFQQRQYRDAIRAFEGLLASRSDHSLSDNCQYWIGEANYMLGDYRAAILSFEKVFTYKQSNKNDYAQYKLGLCYFYLNERERAQQEFQSLLDNHKNSALVDKAQQYMARL